MRPKFLVPVAVGMVLLALLGGVLLWRMFGSIDKARRPLPVLREEAMSGATPGVQRQATLELTEYAGDPRWNVEALAALREIVSQSRSAEVKAVAMDGLKRAKDWDSLPVIFGLMDDASEELRGRAGVAARELVGADYGFRASDPPEKRRAIIAVMHAYYDDMNKAKANRPPESEAQP